VSGNRRRRGGQQQKRKQATGRDFWGTDAIADDVAVDSIRPLEDPTALVSSLGAPPLPSREVAAEYHFALVYEKAAALATALAAASGLLDLAPDED
jgi:hypothetical protein